MTILLFILTLFISTSLSEENNLININFIPTFSNENLILNKKYISNNIDYEFKNIKFYVSDIELILENNLVLIDSIKYHLIDLENLKTIKINNKNNNPIKKIRFNLGIDSVSNTSGIMEGDLDPTLGMYWTWQSGYINIRVEGKSEKCPARKNLFQYHLGGYLYPNLAIQELEFNINNQDNIIINIDIEKYMNNIDITKNYQIMSPSITAVELSKIFANCITIK